MMTARQFGIKLVEYFPLRDENGNVKKSKNGRAMSIFSDEGSHTTAGHTYHFDTIQETRMILAQSTGKDISYWEGGADRWTVDPKSSAFPERDDPNSYDESVLNDIINGKIRA
jgi:hypothetical protein